MDFDPALRQRPVTSHPRDTFAAVRFSLRIPATGINVFSVADSSIVVLTLSLTTRTTRTTTSEPSLDSQFQSCELCFHSGLVADPSKPISLHFDLSLSTYITPLIMPCPLPSYYVPDIPQVFDMVNPSSPTHCFATLAAAVAVAVVAITIALVGGAFLDGRLFHKQKQLQGGACPVTAIHDESPSLVRLHSSTPPVPADNKA
ncbi:uncharacterized protein GLRG_08273 [Colletotrichum graminicola M1.001]|uniref:Uncharacterized protein n=1 Tax=Colletotrichum graminicola (strain M1.001 / M2 / FGSC 10212) TaxID=645133 RepID=E3QQJ1_COLGM|nr:uncharacterized protein GLRG_08273 [Colletotrichum graminicola M1.001]EFQ33129.1 hypothetical protein GLRG_08273 [Colletotrichum graminicola M1.001]